MFQAYAEAVGMEPEVLDAARRTLTRALESSSANKNPSPSCHVAFSSVELEGFGSFLDAVQYQLDERGMVVVTVRAQDARGVDICVCVYVYVCTG